MTSVDQQLGLHDMSGPRIIVNDPDSVVGIELQDHTIVALHGANDNTELGVLPHDILHNAPHINTHHTVITDTDSHEDRTGIPLNTAPDTYISTVEDEFKPLPWLPKANKYAARTDATSREAVIMAIAEHIDATGAGQPDKITDITGWDEGRVQELLNELLLSKQTLYRRQYNTYLEDTGGQ